MDRPKTLLIDIDGVLLRHNFTYSRSRVTPDILPGVLDKFDEWDRKGYNIILLTGRRESERVLTETQLQLLGIIYDKLIMGVGGGTRVLINDYKAGSDSPTAVAICLKRDEGLCNVVI